MVKPIGRSDSPRHQPSVDSSSEVQHSQNDVRADHQTISDEQQTESPRQTQVSEQEAHQRTIEHRLPGQVRQVQIRDELGRSDIASQSGRGGSTAGVEPGGAPHGSGPAAPIVQTGSASHSQWHGRIIQAGELRRGEALEQEVLPPNNIRPGDPPQGAPVRVLPYGEFDPNLPPTVLVHGVNDSPERMEQMAERLRADGHQVFIAFYHDRTAAPHESGAGLATELQQIHDRYYPNGRNMDIVAHSMGGVVARSALMELQSPGSMGVNYSSGHLQPRAGFDHMRLRTLDTPWAGGVGPDDSAVHDTPMIGIAEHAMPRSIWYMRSGSQMFDRLYDQRLEGVDIQNTAVRQLQSRSDQVASIDDFSPQERQQLVDFVLHSPPPGSEDRGNAEHMPSDTRVRNFARALQQDSRYGEFRSLVRQAVDDGRLSATDPTRTQELDRAYITAMPAVWQEDPRADALPSAAHTRILNDPQVINNLVRDLHLTD